MCRCQPQIRTPWCPKCCDHDGERRWLEGGWPTGEAVEICCLCLSSRTHWEQGESGWVYIKDLEKERIALEKELGDASQTDFSKQSTTFDDWWNKADTRDRSPYERSIAERAWHASQRETERQIRRAQSTAKMDRPGGADKEARATEEDASYDYHDGPPL